MSILTVLYHLLTAQDKLLDNRNYDDEQSSANGQKQDDKSDPTVIKRTSENTDRT